MGRRWYQNVGIEGLRYEDPAREGSQFWNEGKWHHFVEPLLPRERGVFVEIGCNAGLFLRMATEAGFRRVIGVEASPRVMAQAEAYRDHVGGDWRLVQQRVGADFAPGELPLADVVLLSNVHYYFPVGVLCDLVDRLKSRSLRCLVVSARAKRWKGNAAYDLASVRGYFREWREMGVVEGLDGEGDPAPRRDMYGVAFTGSLDARNLPNTYGQHRRSAVRAEDFKRHALLPALEDFFGKALSGGEFELEETLLWRYWETMGMEAEAIRDKLEYKRGLALDIQANGMREPIYYDGQGKLLDGIHRLVIALTLGYEHILVRRL